MSVDFEKQVTDIVATIEPEYTLAPETIPITVSALEEVNRRYGPDSDNPLPFHDAPHSLGVTRRGVILTNILWPYINPKHQRKLFDAVMIGGATHDLEQGLEPHIGERASTEWAIARVTEADGPLNTKIFKKRLMLGNLATAFEVDRAGRLVQINLLRGSRDPIKFIMGAADMGGIAMEGPDRMWHDGTGIYLEKDSDPTARGLSKALPEQERFMRQRFNDERVKSEIAFYFPRNQEAIYQDLYDAFHENIVQSVILARKLGEKPELQATVERAVCDPMAGDRIRLPSMIAKLIHKIV